MWGTGATQEAGSGNGLGGLSGGQVPHLRNSSFGQRLCQLPECLW